MSKQFPVAQAVAEWRETWPITAEAESTAANLSLIPLADGGLQYELHAGGIDLEILIDYTGRVGSVYVEPVLPREASNTGTRDAG